MMPRWFYRSKCGLYDQTWAGEDPPKTLIQGGRVLFLEHELVDMAALRAEIGMVVACPARPSQRDRHFESRSACRWDPDAPRINPKNGKPQFDGPKEVREYVAKKNHKEDVSHQYGEL